MKKVIFICLLSLSTCLTKPNPPEAPGKAEDALHPNTAVKPTEPAAHPTPSPVPIHIANVTPANATTAVKNETTNSTKPTDNNTKTTTDATHTEKPAGNDDKHKGDQNKDDKNVTPTKPISPNPPTPTNKGTATTPADTEKKGTTTVKPDTPMKSTEAPSKPTDAPSKEDSKIVQARGFDGASFIGGIILTLGLLAIGFMGFKYYKNQTERNYHTL